MTGEQIGQIVSGLGLLFGGGFVWELIKTALENRRIKAETGKIKVETEGIISRQWHDLFDVVSREWESAKNTILESRRIIEEQGKTIKEQGKAIHKLQTELAEEKRNCSEDMDMLRKQIMKMQTKGNGNH